ncbi:CaiB/BaiF CoA transferase family protein [Phaeovulum vinaykumarii]|uniref:Alpha-methylacyl-CoA racemase n=1 Tax=Phaeovulum vinaykumarii TaxID=407234 RepID=A0A1N7JPI3_9RHOB|nr:CaiB/BaiF CoA-transferase family protein [Phaeovulum vinaykumarii]SIS51248.1 alpha-methylacyl-CoA racemase [Phaeovulum vinaykumarii]SOB90649.1 alpha-methylacyl-CoA racemase [Phaeovulum vinaykumarii]
MDDRTGPLQGLRVIEISGLGPTPFTAMLLADMGADVLRIARPGGGPHVLGLAQDVLDRGRDVVEIDLKSPDGKAAARALILRADALIEGMRPGAMERLGLGPGDFPDHPALVYGRMTGWGQTGPLAPRAGHDITYLALTGALHAIGPADRPAIPLNLLGDFGGGGLYLAFGLLAALLHARATGQGQVVDAAITDGVAHLMAMIWGMTGQGAWSDRRANNLLDGAAPFYTLYACACGGHVAVGAIEPQFWTALLAGLGLDPATLPDRALRANWPDLRARLAGGFATRRRDDWAEVFAATDACVAPVLSLAEAPLHPQNAARGTFVTHEGLSQPAPAPRLSATPGRIGAGSAQRRLTPAEALARWGAAGGAG